MSRGDIMNLSQLTYFKTIVQQKSFTRAAKSLHVTQSTLSHAINELEAEFKVPLLTRSKREVTTTYFGEILLGYVNPALNLLTEAQSKLKDIADLETGVVSLGYFSSLNDLITYTLSIYYKSSGKILSQFRFFSSSSTQIEQSIMSGSCDIAFTTEMVNPNLKYQTIGFHETVVIVPSQHPLAAQDTIWLKQLQGENIITYENTCQIRTYINQILEDSGVTPNIIFQTISDTVIVSSVAASFGVAIVPKPLVMPIHSIKILRILDKIPPRSIAIAWHKSRYRSHATDRFLNYVIENSDLLDSYLQQKHY